MSMRVKPASHRSKHTAEFTMLQSSSCDYPKPLILLPLKVQLLLFQHVLFLLVPLSHSNLSPTFMLLKIAQI